MKREVDLTATKIVDVADQPRGEYMLYYSLPAGSLAVVWIDGIEVSNGVVIGYRNGMPVVTFSDRLPWSSIHHTLVEVYTLSEFQEMERTNLADRVRLKKDFERVAGAAEKDDNKDEEDKGRWNMGDLR